MRDTRFFTNEDNEKLSQRLGVIIGQNTAQFDSLTGYFYITGYKLLHDALNHVGKIRILIGMGSDLETIDAVKKAQHQDTSSFKNSDQTRGEYRNKITEEFEVLDDSITSHHSTEKFIADVKSGRIEVRAYPEQGLHAKLYIMHYGENSMDKGRCVTGSSNFSLAGLTRNLELNVELKDCGDYQYATEYFNKLWNRSVDVSKTLTDTVEQKTWYRDDITPYELFLKFLYEHFKEDINTDGLLDMECPDHYIEYAYQTQAVIWAKRILKQYGGVFLSDVVGLGKTYMGARLAQQLRPEGKILVIAPPALLDKNNKGGWKRVLADFGVQAEFCGIGSIEKIITNRDAMRYKTIIVDESHRFRNQNGEWYADLHQICSGKNVILLSATPYNNSSIDILAQLALFQETRNSTIPGLPDLDGFFKDLEDSIKNYTRRTEPQKYINAVKNASKQIREKILSHVMVRRTRAEIQKFFEQDVQNAGLSFPKSHNPTPIYYKLNDAENTLFNATIQDLKQLKYARYTPKLYLINPDKRSAFGQENLKSIIKCLIVKRMESSISAFISMAHNMKKSSDLFLQGLNQGKVYYTKNWQDLGDILESENEEKQQYLLDTGKLAIDDTELYYDTLKKDVESDIAILEHLLIQWQDLLSKRDVKKDTLITLLEQDSLLQDKVILFTESVVTAKYLEQKLQNIGRNALIAFGGGGKGSRGKIIDNFSPIKEKSKQTKSNDYDILIATDAYAEGINLHSTNVIINYDIPWNSTRMMQRAGRINRLGTAFTDVYIYNFFPSEEVDKEIALQSQAIGKIEGFFELLGEDSGVLTEGEKPEPKGLFEKLSSIDEEEDSVANSELQFLSIIRNIRDTDKKLYEKIKKLPLKSRSSKHMPDIAKEFCDDHKMITASYIRKGYLKKYFVANGTKTYPTDFVTTAKILQSDQNTPALPLKPSEFEYMYKDIQTSITEFEKQYQESQSTPTTKKRTEKQVIKFLNAFQSKPECTDYETDYFKKVIDIIQRGAIHKNKIQKIAHYCNNNKTQKIADFRIFLEKTVPEYLLRPNKRVKNDANRQVVISMVLKNKE